MGVLAQLENKSPETMVEWSKWITRMTKELGDTLSIPLDIRPSEEALRPLKPHADGAQSQPQNPEESD